MPPINQRDIPEIVAELIYEMHEVRSELTALNGRVDRLEQSLETGLTQLGNRFEDSMQHNTNRLIDAFSRSMGQHLPYSDKHDQQLKKYEGCLNALENPSA